jgi:hypothetical protein
MKPPTIQRYQTDSQPFALTVGRMAVLMGKVATAKATCTGVGIVAYNLPPSCQRMMYD